MARWTVLIIAICLSIVLAPVLIVLTAVAAVDTRSSGLFTQIRIGQYGMPFKIFKLRTMVDGRISWSGSFLRKMKLDELPQLLNIIIGDMTFVGPRPDIPGYYDVLQGQQRRVLLLKPGLTSPAAIKYRNEEELLRRQANPVQYNDRVLFPDKLKMNLEYYENRSCIHDLKIIATTVVSLFK